jgi:hypothetical protein
MAFLHVDQRPIRDRCDWLLVELPVPGEPGYRAAVSAALQDLEVALRASELAPGVLVGPTTATLEWTLERGEVELARQILHRALPPAGAPRPLRVMMAALAAIAAGAMIALTGSTGAAVLVGLLALLCVVLAVPAGGKQARRILYLVTDVRLTWLLGQLETLETAPASRVARRIYQQLQLQTGRAHTGWMAAAAMRALARGAVAAGEHGVLRRVHDDARSLIVEGRVPEDAGNDLAEVLRTAAQAPPEAHISPAVSAQLLWRLLVQAPDAGLAYKSVELELTRAQHRYASHVRSEDAPPWARYDEARELFEIAPDRRVESRVTALEDYLQALRAAIARALEPADPTALRRLLADIESYAVRNGRHGHRTPEADHDMIELLDLFLAEGPADFAPRVRSIRHELATGA